MNGTDIRLKMVDVGCVERNDIPTIMGTNNKSPSLHPCLSTYGDYLFSFNHKEFEGICRDLVLALKGVI